MSGYRITKTICPSCRGSGISPVFGWVCMWCRGSKRLSVADVEFWSVQTWVIAGAGHIAGDYGFDDMRRMEGEAEAARRLAGLPPIGRAA